MESIELKLGYNANMRLAQLAPVCSCGQEVLGSNPHPARIPPSPLRARSMAQAHVLHTDLTWSDPPVDPHASCVWFWASSMVFFGSSFSKALMYFTKLLFPF